MVFPRISLKFFYLAGFLTFCVTFVCQVVLLVLGWGVHNFFSASLSLAQIVFSLVLSWFFLGQWLDVVKSEKNVLSDDDVKKMFA